MTDATAEGTELVDELRSLATSLKRPGGKESRVTRTCTRAAAALDDLRARLAAAEGREASLEKRRDYYRERMEAAEALATTATARPACGNPSRSARPPRRTDMIDSKAVARPLDWQETFVDRGDGSQEPSGWEADSGFGWYSIQMYFGSDSYGWQVMFDCDVIADRDDPDGAKSDAQANFEEKVRACLLSATSPAAEIAGTVGEIEALKALLQRFLWKERGIMADLSTAHSNRGQGAASWMREDDRDQVEALEKLFAETRSALSASAGNRADANLKIGQTGVTQEGVEYVVVPKEPTEEQIEAMHQAWRETRSSGPCGMSIDAQWRAEYSRELAAYRAMTSPSALSANGGK